ncbi:MAG: glycoside hydrolase family 78 protein [Propionibacteriaceae bacterium]|jgi:alpha-L-rhamnosidase|nr:glycoside hydrolase family 78 protein [Propionibacteriaceae bacterium]
MTAADSDDAGQAGRAALARARMVTAAADRPAAVAFEVTAALAQPPAAVRRARLFATAQGVYEAQVNGQNAADGVLAPGWTSYQQRLAWQEHDVTAAVAAGPAEARIRAVVGNGWHRGDFGPWAAHNYGDHIGFLAALAVEFRDGERQCVATSADWQAWTTDTTANSLYHGQRIDARLRGREQPLPIRETAFDHGVLVPQAGPAVRRQEVLRPVRIWRSPAGRTLLDFGQNLVGWLRFTVRGPVGAEIVIRHAETLEDGELAVAPLRGAEATDRFVLSGGTDFFEPTFTCHGFRYAEVTGWPGEMAAADVEAVVVGSDLKRTGWFECSDPRVNQLVHNAVWSQKGNFLSIPTDCPQRDERLGWTGDIAVYGPTAAFQFDVADFLHSWLLDLAAEQRGHGGVVPWTVPRLMNVPDEGWDQPAAIWGDAAVWVPEALWQAYGDVGRLAAHYPAMAAHLRSVEALLSPSGLWDTGFQFGDWLDPDSPPQDAQAAKADAAVVATACVFRSARFAAEAAGVLGHGDAAHWTALADRVRQAFNAHYVRDGLIRSDCATVYALALRFGLLDEPAQGRAAARLAELVRAAGHRATTGFAGTPYVTWALSEHGHTADAYRLLLQDDCPSWLYQVAMGATTTWERWDSVLPDGRLNDPVMTSLNHYALGSVCDWLYQVVAGIRPAAPGYRRLLIHPRPGPGIAWAKARYDSAVGPIRVEWRQDGRRFALHVELPEGLPADVALPDGRRLEVSGGVHDWEADLPA